MNKESSYLGDAISLNIDVKYVDIADLNRCYNHFELMDMPYIVIVTIKYKNGIQKWISKNIKKKDLDRLNIETFLNSGRAPSDDGHGFRENCIFYLNEWMFYLAELNYDV